MFFILARRKAWGKRLAVRRKRCLKPSRDSRKEGVNLFSWRPILASTATHTEQSKTFSCGERFGIPKAFSLHAAFAAMPALVLNPARSLSSRTLNVLRSGYSAWRADRIGPRYNSAATAPDHFRQSMYHMNFLEQQFLLTSSAFQVLCVL